ncbi:hypothetical protein [Micromonospora endophytica]|uniref:Uncharacterized protein n=1 Tax=Micromonospora endophytica TaxID=515350 RepID=A0A2W2CZC2_9ACTN|nr:hypothetical protein [Micromonospora endophytica]PZF93749.1 hypothetical protein C1I93_17470 [Micromonospora endophytica]RIW48707.1 hypothetical protein D3H59_05950 [Micromonospora endophytica]BCJ59906.1 hypothetical protein Jiend_33280 [Micromonospora endophytica]
MPVQAHRPEALAWQVFRGSDAVRRGLLTIHQLRNSAWVRLRRDIYADARLERDHELVCRAVALQLPADAAIAGPSAAYLHGVEHAAGFTEPVHVLAPTSAGLRSQRGLRVHTMARDELARLARRGSPPRTSPTRVAWESAVWLEPTHAIGIIDSLLGRNLTSRSALAEIAEACGSRPGMRRARWLFDLAEPAAQSPTESQLRIRLVLAGLPRPVVRHPVQVSRGLILHPDLAWPEFRVAVEYDGRWHSDHEQLHRDRKRLNQLVGAGWLVLHVTSRRLHRDFPAIVREVRSALLDRGWQR